MKYLEKLKKSIIQSQSLLCVGLDPDVVKIKTIKEFSDLSDYLAVEQFLVKIIELTSPYCSSFKPNLAFFEALGPKGLSIFERILKSIPEDKIIIADAKRGDIGNTAVHYCKAFYEYYKVDAITLNPLMGLDTLEPFLADSTKAVYVLLHTSNPGADDFFNQPAGDFQTLSHLIAAKLGEIQRQYPGHIGVVLGATKPQFLSDLTKAIPQSSILIPGIGTQGGVINDISSQLLMLPNIPIFAISRSISYPDSDKKWQDAVVEAADFYKKQTGDLINV